MVQFLSDQGLPFNLVTLSRVPSREMLSLLSRLCTERFNPQAIFEETFASSLPPHPFVIEWAMNELLKEKGSLPSLPHQLLQNRVFSAHYFLPYLVKTKEPVSEVIEQFVKDYGFTGYQRANLIAVSVKRGLLSEDGFLIELLACNDFHRALRILRRQKRTLEDGDFVRLFFIFNSVQGDPGSLRKHPDDKNLFKVFEMCHTLGLDRLAEFPSVHKWFSTTRSFYMTDFMRTRMLSHDPKILHPLIEADDERAMQCAFLYGTPQPPSAFPVPFSEIEKLMR